MPDAPMLVYMISVINLSRRQATITSSETGESFERSVAASRRWWALMEAEDCLFIVIKAKRALKTAVESFYDCFFGKQRNGGLSSWSWG